jgi:hypothetical protein
VDLDQVSCPTVGSCLAIGGYIAKGGHPEGLIETLLNGTWNASEAPLPKGTVTDLPYVLLDALSCPATSACAAVGQYNAGNDTQGLIETSSAERTAPSITSSNQTTFTLGTANEFSVTATGNPVPTITEKGKLPTGLAFDKGKGVSTISGTPRASDETGRYPVTITASNRVAPKASQSFTLTVQT